MYSKEAMNDNMWVLAGIITKEGLCNACDADSY
jgi:hypothetical protein